MGTVPVLQEAGRAVSCFEEGSRVVFLQSAAWREAGSSGLQPCRWVLGVASLSTPSWPGGAMVEMQPGGGGAKQAPAGGKKKAGRKRVVTSPTDLGPHPGVIKTPNWPCPAQYAPLPQNSALPGAPRSAGLETHALQLGTAAPLCYLLAWFSLRPASQILSIPFLLVGSYQNVEKYSPPPGSLPSMFWSSLGSLIRAIW